MYTNVRVLRLVLGDFNFYIPSYSYLRQDLQGAWPLGVPRPRKTSLSPDLPHEFSVERLPTQKCVSWRRRTRRHHICTCSATMKTTWKEIPPVPTSQEFLDVVLSRTQRRLPTQIRSGFQISRIRNFYTRKVKYTQETFTEKLSLILGSLGALELRLLY